MFMFRLFFPAASLLLNITDHLFRMKFYGLGQESRAEANSGGERRIPPQKTRSFKGEWKKAQNWFWRPFSGQMSPDYDSSNGDEYTTMITAAAFAINSLEEASSQKQKKISNASKKKSEGIDPRMPESAATSGKMPQKAVDTVPAIKKTSSFVDQYSNDMRSTKPESAVDRSTIPISPFTSIPTLSTSGGKKQMENSTRPGSTEKMADSWEKTEMDKIGKRYNTISSTILSWEDWKKLKAKRQIDRTESELKLRRARALQHYQSEITKIDQIAGGERARAEERRRNDESKAKEKVKKIRSTGKIPVTCFCF
ncbi:hypothetical protein HHK36_007314 [Tetracentron sinense]|uniref:Remorin C-terminal domain-containing protein n=1 Tax=Tetracentron sinense TaxID=13715 RepID=A0A834ZTA8_TETSI|nr:hypothetical protein HHK36_007314 [Tetracentron sinense]